MPVACGGTTRKLGRLPLLLLLAPSARVRSSPRTYSVAAAAAPAGGAATGGGPRGQPGAGGGAAGGAAAAWGGRSPSPACSGCRASPSPPRPRGGLRRGMREAARGVGPAGVRPGSLLHPSSAPPPWTPPRAIRGWKAGLGTAGSLATALGALPRAALREPPRESGAWWAVSTEALTQFSGARRGKRSAHVLRLGKPAGTETGRPGELNASRAKEGVVVS